MPEIVKEISLNTGKLSSDLDPNLPYIYGMVMDMTTIDMQTGDEQERVIVIPNEGLGTVAQTIQHITRNVAFYDEHGEPGVN